MFFIVVLPAFFYVIFGATQDARSEDAGNGNVAMFIMISMAAYGAATATTSIGGMAAVERMQGWGRQLGLTPLRDSASCSMKTLLAVTVGAVPICHLRPRHRHRRRGNGRAWVLSGAARACGAMVWALYGLCVGLVFKSEAAVGAASGCS